jgi:hypothetical protein
MSVSTNVDDYLLTTFHLGGFCWLDMAEEERCRRRVREGKR